MLSSSVALCGFIRAKDMDHIIVDIKTGLTVKSKAKTLQGLRKYADKLDLQYGAVRYIIKKV